MTIADPYVAGRLADLDAAIASLSGWHQQDAQLSAHLGTYLCVLASGVFEDSIEALVCKRAGKAGDADLEAFVRSVIEDTFRNPDVGKIKDILKRFGPSYRQAFDARVNRAATTALDSILIVKTDVAHGTPARLVVNIPDAVAYVRRAIAILEAIEDILQ